MLNSFHSNSDLIKIKSGINLGLSDLLAVKPLIDEMILKKKYGEFEYFSCELPYTVPIATAATITPWCTSSGEQINRGINKNTNLDLLTFTILPQKSKTIIIMAAFKIHKISIKILNDLNYLFNKNQRMFQLYLSYLLLHEDNTFISPFFYESKDLKWRKKYCEFISNFHDINLPILDFSQKFPINYFDKKEALNLN